VELQVSACRSCSAPIVWVGTERGKAMPLDAQPYDGDDPSGLFVIRVVDGKALAIAVPPEAFAGEPLYRSHFATCPQADQWRRRP
jgi:hypothetical protein